MNPFSKHTTNYSDIKVLAATIGQAHAQIFVFDPKGKVNWDVIRETNEPTCSSKSILFNFGGELIRYKEFNLDHFDWIVDFSLKIGVNGFSKEKLRLIQSPTGIARYVIQRNDKKFHFLDFIQTPTLRSKIMKNGLRLMVHLRGIGKRFNLLYQEQPHHLKDFQARPGDNYSIFLGTPGFMRKPVIQFVRNNAVKAYVKLGITPQTNYLIQKEKSNLKRIGALGLNQAKIPEIYENQDRPALLQKAFHDSAYKRQSHLQEHHFHALKELSIKSMKIEKMTGTDFYSEILDHLHYLKNAESNHYPKTLFYLNKLNQSLDHNLYRPTSIAHGDFTPWNVFGTQPLHMYDWEMAVCGAPLLYDAFHFIYQSEILVNRTGIKGVEKELIRFFQMPLVADFVNRFDIDLDMHHQLYLLHVISKNLTLVNRQPHLSNDQKLLFETWQSTLLRLTKKWSVKDARTTFLLDFQLHLADKNYAALKLNLPNFHSLPISSDLDLAIHTNELPHVKKFISDHFYVVKHVTVQKTFMTTSQIYLLDGSFVSVDFIHDFMRKGNRYMDIQSVLLQAKAKNGVKRPILFHDIEYAQHFYTLNKSPLPLKYQQIFSKALREKGQHQIYLDSFERKYKIRHDKIIDAFNYSSLKRKMINKYIQRKHKLNGFVWLREKFGYLLDFLVDLKQNRGFIVTFSGVDGAGKTTIIEAVKTQFEKKYRKEIVLLRHRPGILPILSTFKYGSSQKAEQHASIALPRKGTNNNRISSFLRFGYYFTDYFFGQIYVYIKYILRGKIVIYDRYYFDFINDARRSNIQLKPSFIKRLFLFIYKPDFNFYLYNDPEVILERKQELSAADITNLNHKYEVLFREFDINEKGEYLQIKNNTKSETIAQIFDIIHKVA